MKQLMSHPLTDIGIERFLKDYETLKEVSERCFPLRTVPGLCR